MTLIDTHAHLDYSQFANDLAQVVKNAEKSGVKKIITIGCTGQIAKQTIQIAENYPFIFAAIGIHPEEPFSEEGFETIEKLATHPKVVAIGECGLDFFRPENPPQKEQIASFARHIALARKVNKPLIIHLRNARSEALEFLKNNHDFPFVVHCFTEDIEFAEQIIAWGGMISFTGIITYPNAQQVRAVAQKIPLEKIMLETDCPFLAPQKYRGQRCEPAHTVEIAEKIAELKNLSLAEVAAQTTRNSEQFFQI